MTPREKAVALVRDAVIAAETTFREDQVRAYQRAITREGRDGSRWALETMLEIAIQVTDALEAEHLKGIRHGNIRPESIVVTSLGSAKLLDCGGVRDRTCEARAMKVLVIVEREMHEAIAFHLEGLRAEGYPVPEPRSYATYVEVAR